MIKFFRKIRQKLIAEGRLSKYLLYALGEVLLVMIGILLALQVNNWNETRQNRKVELELYQNLLSNLQNDSLDLVTTIERAKDAIAAQQLFIENSAEDLLAKYSMEEIELAINSCTRNMASFFPRYGAFDQITNNGYLPLLQSVEIKNKMIALYDRAYKRYQHMDEGIEEKGRNYVNPITKGKLHVFPEGLITYRNLKQVERFDKQKFKQYYPDLAEQCRSFFYMSNGVLRTLEDIQLEVIALQQLIREEIKRHKN